MTNIRAGRLVTGKSLLGQVARGELRSILMVFSIVVWTASLGTVPAYLTGRLLDGVLARHDLRTLVLYTLGMVSAALVAALLSVLQGRASTALVQRMIAAVRRRLAMHVARLPYVFFTERRAGEVYNRVTSDIDSLESLGQNLALGLLANIANVAAIGVALFLVDVHLALAAIVSMLPFFLPLGPISKGLYTGQGRIRLARDDLSSAMYDLVSLSGALLFKLFGRSAETSERIDRASRAVLLAEVHLTTQSRWYNAILGFMMAVSPAVVWLLGGLSVARGELSVGALVAFVTLQARLFVPIGILANAHAQLSASRAVLDRIAEYLSIQTEGDGAASSFPLAPGSGAVAFTDVSFAYADGQPVLRDFSLAISAGSSVAIVGASGSGKSTICALLLKLFDPDAGMISIDGQDLAHATTASVREEVGLVTQESYLLHDTVAANLRYAKPAATQQEIESAARRADVHDVIAALPDGYETVVGERGSKLSGGQRQRLALARIVLKDPRVMILDEATSALDADTEARVKAAFRGIMRDRTAIIVAHRLSTVLAAQYVAVLEEGQVAEYGLVDDLVRRPSALQRHFPELARPEPLAAHGSAINAY